METPRKFITAVINLRGVSTNKSIIICFIAMQTYKELKLLTTCNKLDGIIRLVASLFQQVRYSHDINNNIVTTLCRQPCNILVIS